MARVFLGLGSNEGDRLANLSRATHALAAAPGIRLVQMAPIYETKPVGGPPQDDFLNTVIELQTERPPHDLLELAKTVETRLGRQPPQRRWGPRVIDIDILLYDALILQDERLTIPHAHMHTRRFVLEPLAQLAPEVVHPVSGHTIAELLGRLPIPSSSDR